MYKKNEFNSFYPKGGIKVLSIYEGTTTHLLKVDTTLLEPFYKGDEW